MLSENIRNLRKMFNISQVDLASSLGVTKQCVSNWENDNILPSIEMLVKIAKFFNVSTDYLLDLNSSKVIDVSDLDENEIAHIKFIVQDLKRIKNSSSKVCITLFMVSLRLISIISFILNKSSTSTDSKRL